MLYLCLRIGDAGTVELPLAQQLGLALDRVGAVLVASQYQGQAVIKSKELAETADVYVKDNPWRTVAAAASVGLLVGIYLGRK